MKLSQAFEAIAYKQLVACDLPNQRSHQHELTGVSALRSVLGTASKVQGNLTWVMFADGSNPRPEENTFTFYDARAKGAARTGRSEWRLYYHGNFLAHAKIGDLLVLAKTKGNGFLGMIFAQNSGAYAEAMALFAFDVTARFESIPITHLENHEWDLNLTPNLAHWFDAKLLA